MLSFEQQRQYLESYVGTNPIPADFDDFWAARMAEADSCPLKFWLEPAEVADYPSCQFFNLWFVKDAFGKKTVAGEKTASGCDAL